MSNVLINCKHFGSPEKYVPSRPSRVSQPSIRIIDIYSQHYTHVSSKQSRTKQGRKLLAQLRYKADNINYVKTTSTDISWHRSSITCTQMFRSFFIKTKRKQMLFKRERQVKRADNRHIDGDIDIIDDQQYVSLGVVKNGRRSTMFV